MLVKEIISIHKLKEIIKAYSNNFTTMTPGPVAKWMRTCVIFQFFRFIAINIKMLVVVKKSH
jgi:hypothetical protein